VVLAEVRSQKRAQDGNGPGDRPDSPKGRHRQKQGGPISQPCRQVQAAGQGGFQCSQGGLGPERTGMAKMFRGRFGPVPGHDILPGPPGGRSRAPCGRDGQKDRCPAPASGIMRGAPAIFQPGEHAIELPGWAARSGKPTPRSRLRHKRDRTVPEHLGKPGQLDDPAVILDDGFGPGFHQRNNRSHDFLRGAGARGRVSIQMPMILTAMPIQLRTMTWIKASFRRIS